MEEIGEGAYGIVFKGVNNAAGSSESKIPPNRKLKLPTVVAIKVV